MISETRLKLMAHRYNTYVKDKVDSISKPKLMYLLRSNNIPYKQILIELFTAKGYLVLKNNEFTASKEPVDYTEFKKLYDLIPYHTNNYYTKKEREYKNIPDIIITENNKYSKYDILKELILKGVSDDKIKILFPDLNT